MDNPFSFTHRRFQLGGGVGVNRSLLRDPDLVGVF